MRNRRHLIVAGLGSVLLGVSVGLGGCATGSSRTDYLALRNTSYQAQAGDGSVIAMESQRADTSWALTYAQNADGSISDSR